MNCSGSWTIHGLRLCYLQSSTHEAVCNIPRMGCDAADGVRLARLKGKKYRL